MEVFACTRRRLSWHIDVLIGVWFPRGRDLDHDDGLGVFEAALRCTGVIEVTCPIVEACLRILPF